MLRDYAASKRSILNHSGYLIVDGMPSLVGSLRPYRGLSEDTFLDLMMSLIGVHDAISRPDRIEREIVCSCWCIRSRISILALDEQSPLRRNRLISEEDLGRIHHWHRAIDTFCWQCFHGSDLQSCASAFADYVGSPFCLDPSVYQGLVPFFREQLSESEDDILEIYQLAIRAVGGE